MILPTKHITEENTLLGVGAVILQQLSDTQTVSSLWSKVESNPIVGNYKRFILALDFLFIIGVIHLEDGLIGKIKR